MQNYLLTDVVRYISCGAIVDCGGFFKYLVYTCFSASLEDSVLAIVAFCINLEDINITRL